MPFAIDTVLSLVPDISSDLSLHLECFINSSHDLNNRKSSLLVFVFILSLHQHPAILQFMDSA